MTGIWTRSITNDGFEQRFHDVFDFGLLVGLAGRRFLLASDMVSTAARDWIQKI
jgi:hypothetical protein